VKDESFGEIRWAVVDSKSGSHLGHVFDDGLIQLVKILYEFSSIDLCTEGGNLQTSSKQ